MLMMASGPARSQDRRAPSLHDAIVLFGAHWCAPCRGEYRNLPALIAAAAPDRLVIAWIDRSIGPPAGVLPGEIAVLGVEDAQTLAGRIGGEGYGLPFSAMFDSAGRVCSVWRKPLGAADIKALKAAC